MSPDALKTLAFSKELADVAIAFFTAYLSARTAYIWYKYLRKLVPTRTPGSLLSRLKTVLEENPPSAFPSGDLPIATIALALSCSASVLLYLGLKISG